MWVCNMWLLALRNTAEMRLLVIIKDTLQLDRKAGGGGDYKHVRQNKSNNVIRNGQNTFYEGIKLPIGKCKGKFHPVTGHEGPEVE